MEKGGGDVIIMAVHVHNLQSSWLACPAKMGKVQRASHPRSGEDGGDGDDGLVVRGQYWMELTGSRKGRDTKMWVRGGLGGGDWVWMSSRTGSVI